LSLTASFLVSAEEGFGMGEVARALLAVLERSSALSIEHDPEWPSPCEVLPPDAEGMVRWRPVPMDPPAGFADVEAMARLRLHPDIVAFYGSFWGWNGAGQHSGEPVSLRMAWNADDLVRIKRGLVEHLAVCAAHPTPPTVYVANTASDWFFSVDNATCEVLMEEPGHPRLRVVAPSLAWFLAEM
jgi:SecY interacting protein Syd